MVDGRNIHQDFWWKSAAFLESGMESIKIELKEDLTAIFKGSPSIKKKKAPCFQGCFTEFIIQKLYN